jgi:hypothetical protein
MLTSFQVGLREKGYRAQVYALTEKDGSIQWQLEVVGKEAIKLLRRLDFRHDEKMEAKVPVQSYTGKPWSEVGPMYGAFRERINKGRDRCVDAARKAFSLRFKRKKQKAGLLRTKMVKAKKLWNTGHEPESIVKSFGRSLRTVYRWHKSMKKGIESND